MIQSNNMNYAFNVEYMEYAVMQDNSVNSTTVEQCNKKLIDVLEGDNKNIILAFGNNQISELQLIANTQRSYKVTYPGLLIGLGNPHMTKKMKGEVQLGFSFDYVTGAPYYPGSSLKGVIRNVFHRAVHCKENNEKGTEDEKKDNERILNEYQQYIIELIMEKKREKKISAEDISTEDIKNLLKDGFEATDQPVHQRDKFFDTYVVGISTLHKGSHSIMGLDNLAPHGDVLKNPIPITMLRIMPGTCITFSMLLHDSNVKGKDGEPLLSKEEKAEVYFQIIQDFGIGAKTNVGYGVLESIDECQITRKIEIESKVGQKQNQNVEKHVCKKCGEPTKPNKDGVYYSLCFKCNQNQYQRRQ